MKTLDIELGKVYDDKCAYRLLVEQYLKKEGLVPEQYTDCEDCPGMPTALLDGCTQYTTIDHLLDFYTSFKN